MTEKIIQLGRSERIVAVVPEESYGPGWANEPTWVYIHDGATGQFRCECIQPEERRDALHFLHESAAAMHRALKDAVLTSTEE